MLNSPNILSNRCSYFWSNIFSWYCSSIKESDMSWWHHLMLKMLACNQQQEFLWPRNIHLWAFVAHLHSNKPQSGPLLTIEYCISVLDWNSKIFQYPKRSYGHWNLWLCLMIREISDFGQRSYHVCLMTQNSHLNQISKENSFFLEIESGGK
jgi:hypothetical protein